MSDKDRYIAEAHLTTDRDKEGGREMKVWIVVEECEDRHYAPSPTGEVFTDEAKAKAYVEAVNADPKVLLYLTLVEGELK